MSKQLKKSSPHYSRAERRAEAEIDKFLQGISPPSTRSVLDQLRNASHLS